MLIFLPIMLFLNSQKIPDNSQEMYLLCIAHYSQVEPVNINDNVICKPCA